MTYRNVVSHKPHWTRGHDAPAYSEFVKLLTKLPHNLQYKPSKAVRSPRCWVVAQLVCVVDFLRSGTNGLPETSVLNYQHTLRNPEERKPPLYRGRRLKSRLKLCPYHRRQFSVSRSVLKAEQITDLFR